eukprot:403804_1
MQDFLTFLVFICIHVAPFAKIDSNDIDTTCGDYSQCNDVLNESEILLAPTKMSDLLNFLKKEALNLANTHEFIKLFDDIIFSQRRISSKMKHLH